MQSKKQIMKIYKVKTIFFVFITIIVLNVCLLSSSQVEIPEWLLLGLSIKGDLRINHDNLLQLNVKSLTADLKDCEIEPVSDDRTVYFYPLEKNKLDFKKGKTYQLSMKFRVLDTIKSGYIGIKLKTYYPAVEIIKSLKKRYPQDSLKRQEKIEYLISRQGKIAEFEKRLDVHIDNEFSYTSTTGIPPFYVKKVDENTFFSVMLNSEFDISKKGLEGIDREIKDKLGYCELLKDPAIKFSLSDDPVIERRNILKKIFELKFSKLLLKDKLNMKSVLVDLEKFIKDFEKTRIIDKHFWREIVCFYLFIKSREKSVKLNKVIEDFLELKVKDWNLSFVYYNYAVFLINVEKNLTRASDFLKLALKLNSYLHIGRKLLGTLEKK
ncbi:hypothetical protein KAJ27_06005 [bacterium]|nr:hypothetical protein [bacterium]